MKRLCVLLLLMVPMVSCKAKGGKARVAFANATYADPWRRSLNELTQAEADKHKDLLVLEMFDGQDDNARQIGQIETAIMTGVKVLIVSPNEAAALTSVVKKAYEKGIFTIVIDRNVLGDSYHTFIGASNFEIGKAAGAYVAEQLKGRGTVVVHLAARLDETAG